MEKTQKRKTIIHFLVWATISTFFGLSASLTGVYLYLSPNLPAIESLKKIELQTPLRVYSIDNKLIGEFGEKRRAPIDLEDAPQALIDAVLAAEDDAFFEHKGVNPKSLLRAALQLLLSGEIQSGGSTITMQVARNFFLSSEQTFSRKFNEILLAIKIERLLSKGEILELYLNRIYLGNRAYGVKAAAQAYYGLKLESLSLAQIAMIAGLPKAPSTYNPIANPKRAKLRRDWILNRMASLNKVETQAAEAARQEPVTARYFGQNLELNAPYVAEQARDKAIELYGNDAYTNGYQVYTTVHSDLQEAAQNAIIKGLLAYDKRHGFRGAEASLDINQLSAPSTAIVDEDEFSEELPIIEFTLEDGSLVDLQPWVTYLKEQSVFSGLEPALVVRVEAEQVLVLTSKGIIQAILWEAGLKETRRFIDENVTIDPPDSPDKLVSVGDLIRINQDTEGNWQLQQIPEVEAGLISINPDDGSIDAMVGGFDFNHNSFNRVIQAKRQPGSNFKPFIYTHALEKGLTTASIFNDAPIVVEDERLESIWRPENASGKFYGPTRLRKALYLSRNLVSIRLLRNLGLGDTIRSMDRFGMDTKAIPRDLSMALGSYVMSPLQVAAAYSVFANGGYQVEPYLIHHIRDRNGEVIYTAKPKVAPKKQALRFEVQSSNVDAGSLKPNENEQMQETSILPNLIENLQISPLNGNSLEINNDLELPSTEAERVIDERVVYLMNSMLKDVVKRGTGRRALALNRSDLAGKTGTTNGPTDAWFSGFNHHAVTTTWVGFDNNQNLGQGEYGGVAALPIWIDYMKVALDGVAEENTAQPDGIVTVRIDPETGERALPSNPNGIFELFLEENAPQSSPTEIGVSSNIGESPAPEELF